MSNCVVKQFRSLFPSIQIKKCYITETLLYHSKGPVIIYGIYRVGKNRSRATKFFVIISTGYEIYLAQKIRVRNFFPFVDTTVAGKLHFRYKMHVETYTHDVVFTKILHVCSNHDILASASLRVTSCLHTVKLSPVPLLFHCTVI